MGIRLFVTSSGTEIGKTFVSAALIHQLRRAGHTVAAYKPVLSGFDDASLGETDTGVLLNALGLEPTADAIDRMTPWRFSLPLSPDMAAAREGKCIVFEELVSFTAAALDGDSDTVLIEAVGGVMAPLNERHTVLDWIAAVRCPALLVVGAYLGSISHTLTAAKALEVAQVPLAGVVISARGKLPVPAGETAGAIARFLPDVAIAIIPHMGDGNEAWQNAPDLLGVLGIAHSPA